MGCRDPEQVAQLQLDDGDIWAGVVFGGSNKTIQTWEYASDAKPLEFFQVDSNVTSLRFSAGHKSLACSAADGSVMLFDYAVRSLESRHRPHDGDAMSADFSADGRTLVSAGLMGQLHFRYIPFDEPTISIDAHDAQERLPLLAGITRFSCGLFETEHLSAELCRPTIPIIFCTAQSEAFWAGISST